MFSYYERYVKTKASPSFADVSLADTTITVRITPVNEIFIWDCFFIYEFISV